MSSLLTWFRYRQPNRTTISNVTTDGPSATALPSKQSDEGAPAPVLVRDQVASVSGVSASLSASCDTLKTRVHEQLNLTEEIREVSEGMEGQVLAAQGRIENLTNCSAEIAAIAETIADIAGQTKLLALNASIESARAGEAGRGFAVVATEVGELAARAGESTRRISAMAAEIDSDTMVATEMMGGLVEAVSENIKLSVTGLVDGLQEASDEVDFIAGEALSLAAQTDEFYDIYGESALSGELKDAVEIMKGAVGEIETAFATAIEDKVISTAELFDEQYRPVPGTSPVKYRTNFDQFTDKVLPRIQEPLLKAPANFAIAACIDRNAYIPTHNRFCSSNPSGDYEWDLVHSRSKRIFDDPAGLKAATNKKPFLVQTSRRDTGDLIHDIAVPIYVEGRLWGNLRCGLTVSDLHESENTVPQC